ncbi:MULTISPECIES: transposase [Sphingomonas]|uniref:transposase n=1 Tax=Sphingomonas TaxID=13687 RepID=UPI001D131C8B
MQTLAAFTAAVDEAGRFKRSRTAEAYFALAPRPHQSGELDGRGGSPNRAAVPSASSSTRLRTRS